MSAFSPEPEFLIEGEEDIILPFALLQLPFEVVLRIIECLNERTNDGVFPSGPSSELIQLSLSNRQFCSLSTPLIFESVNYKGTLEEGSGVRTSRYKKTRNLNSLIEIIESMRKSGRNIEIKKLSICLRDEFEAISSHMKEIAALAVILKEMQLLEIVFLEEVNVEMNGKELLETLSALPRLKALRLNQVDFGWLKNLDTLPTFESLKTLQIMHGSNQFLTLVKKAPNLESLLLWPESRRLASLAPYIFTNLLPKLRLLSLDVVNEPAVILLLAQELNWLHSQSPNDIPLTELFIEGTQKPHERDLLMQALSTTKVKRLALYHLFKVEPSLIRQISDSLPSLQALTLVQGDTQQAVNWPAPLELYTAELSRLRHLTFYASDRLSHTFENDNPPNVTQSSIEYKSFSQIGRAVPSLNEVVAILHDVSEGCTGYFGSFSRFGTRGGGGVEKQRTKLTLQKKTVKDFLINFDRWCL